eukprot:TRINITY_DN5786_c0_g1_i1.p1 TRINITY_DN5786_c0_g1~~TRINITY_DN5786_c0_g1_i1.p1  ORF type:complete len:192 (-),score=13.74 TRINITY_DN5786_c0_g1_i1:19-594(-)
MPVWSAAGGRHRPLEHRLGVWAASGASHFGNTARYIDKAEYGASLQFPSPLGLRWESSSTPRPATVWEGSSTPRPATVWESSSTLRPAASGDDRLASSLPSPRGSSRRRRVPIMTLDQFSTRPQSSDWTGSSGSATGRFSHIPASQRNLMYAPVPSSTAYGGFFKNVMGERRQTAGTDIGGGMHGVLSVMC